MGYEETFVHPQGRVDWPPPSIRRKLPASSPATAERLVMVPFKRRQESSFSNFTTISPLDFNGHDEDNDVNDSANSLRWK
ncbi:hypothetical protein BIW11_04014 [Tropilaelaps mercedesae]|uniref:Uncharacterized protein n=1 Tax=Tropilaelaps mercedesae TaxID=418985 RepID=A0A1V9XCX9_9ACAR|nr:hypothetical protein BIW11_04014 [Tropilaelaps mercedesae]